MSAARIKRGFTIVELVTVIVTFGAMVMLLLPRLAHSAAESRGSTCKNKLHVIGLAANYFENAKNRFPMVSMNLNPGAPSAEKARPANATRDLATGYSWIVQILPHVEEINLYSDISEKSNRFTSDAGPFDRKIVWRENAARHASCVPLPFVVCPEWAGNAYTHKNDTIDAGRKANPDEPAVQGAPEYADVDSSTPGVGPKSFKGQVAPTCYKAMVGTHMFHGMPLGNGGMILAGIGGLRIQDFPDGTSKTFLVAESKECGYSSWYDGTLNWLVANDPNQPPPIKKGEDWSNVALALNKGQDPKAPKSSPYLKKAELANKPENDVWWGPSSDHEEGIVYHLFADGHTVAITKACDPATYLSLTSRDGQEPIDDLKVN